MPSVEPKNSRGLADEEAAKVRRRIEAGRGAAGDEPAAAHERAHGRGPDRLADVLDHDVDAAPVRQRHHLLDHVAAGVEDRLGGANRARARVLVASREVTIARAPIAFAIWAAASETEPPDPENERRLALAPEARLGANHPPGGDPGDAEGGGLKEIKIAGLAEDAVFRRADEAGENPVDLLAQNAGGEAQDFFASAAKFAGSATPGRIDDDRIAGAVSASSTMPGAVQPHDLVGSRCVMPSAAVAHVEIDAG